MTSKGSRNLERKERKELIPKLSDQKDDIGNPKALPAPETNRMPWLSLRIQPKVPSLCLTDPSLAATPHPLSLPEVPNNLAHVTTGAVSALVDKKGENIIDPYKITKNADNRKHHVTKDVDYEKANKSRRKDGYAAANI